MTKNTIQRKIAKLIKTITEIYGENHIATQTFKSQIKAFGKIDTETYAVIFKCYLIIKRYGKDLEWE